MALQVRQSVKCGPKLTEGQIVEAVTIASLISNHYTYPMETHTAQPQTSNLLLYCNTLRQSNFS